MRNIHFHHNALTAAEITTRRLCKLHRVTLFSPAICRVNRGSKVIVQGVSEMLATPQQLIILPAEVELEVINQPENGLFCSDLLSLTPELLADFKHRYMSEPQTGRLTSLCAPLAPEMSFMWQSVLRAVREGLSAELAPSGDGIAAGAVSGWLRRAAAQRAARGHNRSGQANYYAVACRSVERGESG